MVTFLTDTAILPTTDQYHPKCLLLNNESATAVVDDTEPAQSRASSVVSVSCTHPTFNGLIQPGIRYNNYLSSVLGHSSGRCCIKHGTVYVEFTMTHWVIYIVDTIHYDTLDSLVLKHLPGVSNLKTNISSIADYTKLLISFSHTSLCCITFFWCILHIALCALPIASCVFSIQSNTNRIYYVNSRSTIRYSPEDVTTQ